MRSGDRRSAIGVRTDRVLGTGARPTDHLPAERRAPNAEPD